MLISEYDGYAQTGNDRRIDAADTPLIPVVKPFGTTPKQRVAGTEKEQSIAYRASCG